MVVATSKSSLGLFLAQIKKDKLFSVHISKSLLTTL